MTTGACSLGGASGRSDWLNFMSQGAGPVAPPIRMRLRLAFSSRTEEYGSSGLCTLGGNQLNFCE